MADAEVTRKEYEDLAKVVVALKDLAADRDKKTDAEITEIKERISDDHRAKRLDI